MAELVLGPLLRCVDGPAATVWVEADGPCQVEVTAGPATGRARTTAVAGSHYALVVVDGLPDAATTAYQVRLDDRAVWPPPTGDLPPSVIRTADRARPLRVVFGSCRVEAPLRPPYDRPRTEDPEGHGVDALDALARRLARGSADDLPDALALLGDQVYADEVVGPGRRRRRRSVDPPPGSVADLGEYVELYRRSWGHPHVRWLLSTVPSAMVFDDHDVVDDWNISEAWLDRMGREPWWDRRIAGGLVSYWLYQHWGNLTPAQLEGDDLARAVARADDATALLEGRVEGWRLDRADPAAQRWSTCRDLEGSARARLLLLDTRNSRCLAEGQRAIIDGREMAWAAERARVDRDGLDHLLLGSSLPWLLPPGVHDLERSTEAVASGRGGPPGRQLAERARRDRDLEHWPSFGRSFDDLAALLASVAAGEEGPCPSSLLVLSGDVHFSYLAPADLGVDRARVVQLVSSPLRNGVPANLERALRLAASPVGTALGQVGRRLAAGGDEPLRWDLAGGPWFGNGVATLTLDGPRATVRFERSRHDHTGQPDLVTVHEERLAGPPAGV
ncbi:MAG TPA: alkaline phosphatase D family protein [Acidimicrobiales bacterium]|nr:alkaline phosphatase D family protein [Acidimicrobiales bacterium]